MQGGNVALAFGALVAGAVVLDYGVKSARAAFSGSNTPSTGTTGPIGALKKVAGYPTSVNPVPGAVGSRLDQGMDATGHNFQSPWSGHVVYSNPHDSGWQGGGYVAIQSDEDPNFVYYLAEGISPIVKLGQKVTAGQTIAYPVANPYNGIVGNVEFGRANPQAPKQPLAQVVSDPTGMVNDFYKWVEGLGGPKATDMSAVGHA